MVEFHINSQLRYRYWIPQGRTTIKGILRRLKCIRYKGGPQKVKAMVSWPKNKVTMSSRFTNTGIDYFGPSNVKDCTDKNKVRACLFTCIAVRAVHLELVKDISTEHFLEGIKGFRALKDKTDKIIINSLQSK